MIQTDCHLHTSFSSDSSTPMKDMIEKAVELNLKTLCFTEHMDYEFPSHYNLPFTFNVNSFIQKFLEYKCHYKNKIELLMGIELGLKPTYKIKDYTSLTTDYPWDFIIGSTHLVGDIDPYYPEYWNNKSEIDQLQRYYKEIISNLHAFHTFDSLGHLDYIIRYAPSKNTSTFSLFLDYIDEILKFIIHNGIALEINSGGYKAGLGSPNPAEIIIRRYKDLGGERITIGSDAHSTEHIAYCFDFVQDLLLNLGFKYYYIYKNRTPYPVAL